MKSMNGLGYIILISIAFGALFYLIAAKRGANTAFWAAMGVIFGPFALPFVFFAQPRKDSATPPSPDDHPE